ncbi:hypothetical protein OH76DRAFT_1401020 [Lentinus brumalis]|uniref:Uncharacterized protein n=1 Tax=Lentinus brumalis TaxID=2498619 RepID=A0A371DGF9_9APHY|nr:hypothetical protein OH76DRAFT_1401020 [Polyporus brumalis]
MPRFPRDDGPIELAWSDAPRTCSLALPYRLLQACAESVSPGYAVLYALQGM